MPQSDALHVDGEMAEKLNIPADFYTSCPKCGEELLDIKCATPSEIKIALLHRFFSW